MGLTDSLYPSFKNIQFTVINSGFVIIKSFLVQMGTLVVKWVSGGSMGSWW